MLYIFDKGNNMLNAIDEATKSFCTDIIGLEVNSSKKIEKDFYGASIGVYTNDIETQWYLLFKKVTLNKFAEALLFEDDLSEDDLDDLVKEVANLIVGSAKVILEKKNINTCTIDTPAFLGHVPDAELLKLEEILLYEIENHTFVIGKKSEN